MICYVNYTPNISNIISVVIAQTAREKPMVSGSALSSGSFPDSNPLSLHIIYLWLECAGGNVHIAVSSSS